MPILLCNPGVEVSTQKMYQALNRNHIEQGKESMDKTISTWEEMGEMVKHGNDMQERAFSLYPDIKKLYEKMKKTNPKYCQMSGSGATVWAMYEDEEKAKKAALTIKNEENVIFTWTGSQSCFNRI